MALRTRRVITPAESTSAISSSSTRTSSAPGVRPRPSLSPYTRSLRSTVPSKPSQVSWGTVAPHSSARSPLQRAGVNNVKATTSSKATGNRLSVSSRTSSPAKSRPETLNHVQAVLIGHDHHLEPTTLRSETYTQRPADPKVHAHEAMVNRHVQEGEDATAQGRNFPSTDIPEGSANMKQGSGNMESYYNGQSDSDSERTGQQSHENPRHDQQEWRSMAKYAKDQGIDLVKQLEDQKRRRLEQDQEPVDVAKVEMEEMKRILQERRRSSEEYFIPSETDDGDSSPERNSRRTISPGRKDSADLEVIEEVNALRKEDLSKLLDWLQSENDEGDKRIAVSEDRALSFLRILKEGNMAELAGVLREPFPDVQEDWVPMERLREAERRSSAAEEQIRRFEELLVSEGPGADEQLRAILSKSKSMERHFHHMKKFAEDRHSDLKRMHTTSMDKDAVKGWLSLSPRGGAASPEKYKRDFQEHENHKKRLFQVFSAYKELLKFLKIEHSKRLDAENKSQQLSSQVKRQTAALKKAEKVIKHTALSPLPAHESNYFRSGSTPEVRSYMASPSPTPSGMQSPRMTSFTARRLSSAEAQDGEVITRLDSARLNRSMPPLKQIDTMGRSNLRAAVFPSSPTSALHSVTKQLTYDHALEQALSRNPSPDPRRMLSTSDLIAQNHKREFEDLERALIAEGRSRGFADVDLISEKKTVGREETRWEYRHVHFDFNRPHQTHQVETMFPSSEHKQEALDLHSVSNMPTSRRTASPSRSESGAFMEEKDDHILRDMCRGHHHDHHCHYYECQQTSATPSSLAGRRNGDGLEIGNNQNVGLVGKKNCEKVTRSASAKQLETHTLIKQMKAIKRVKSLPGNMTTMHADSSHLLQNVRSVGQKLAGAFGALNTEIHMAKGTELGDTSPVDAAHDAPNETWVDAANEEVLAEVLSNEEGGVDIAETHEEDMEEAKGQADDDVASQQTEIAVVAAEKQQKAVVDHDVRTELNHMDVSNPTQRKSSGLWTCIEAMESSHAAYLLHGQVKWRRRLLLLQVLFFVAAIFWSLSFIGSEPPPT